MDDRNAPALPRQLDNGRDTLSRMAELVAHRSGLASAGERIAAER